MLNIIIIYYYYYYDIFNWFPIQRLSNQTKNGKNVLLIGWQQVSLYKYYCRGSEPQTKASISPFYKIQIPFYRFTIFRVFLFSIKNSTNRPKFTVFLNKKIKIWKSREFFAMF